MTLKFVCPGQLIPAFSVADGTYEWRSRAAEFSDEELSAIDAAQREFEKWQRVMRDRFVASGGTVPSEGIPVFHAGEPPNLRSITKQNA